MTLLIDTLSTKQISISTKNLFPIYILVIFKAFFPFTTFIFSSIANNQKRQKKRHYPIFSRFCVKKHQKFCIQISIFEFKKAEMSLNKFLLYFLHHFGNEIKKNKLMVSIDWIGLPGKWPLKKSIQDMESDSWLSNSDWFKCSQIDWIRQHKIEGKW